MSQASENAREFLSREREFRLGSLLTESFHPGTETLSETIASDIEAGVRMLQSVDRDIPPAAGAALSRQVFRDLIEAFHLTLRAGGRVYFTGCGATGRLSILLEAAWREFWQQFSARHEGLAATVPSFEDRCVSVMAGGDFALIKSVEGFEDFPDFGRRQLREAGVRQGDLVVAITEGGETPFVIGTAWEGLDAGAKVFFVYNNPTDMLVRRVQRSREVIEEPRIARLDLTTGPMAISGSTRMQAVTVELLVVGAALEIALTQLLKGYLDESKMAQLGMGRLTGQEYCDRFEKLLSELESAECVAAMTRMVAFEEDIYRQQGLVTYLADSLLLDVLTDTTERSPTFMVPPFRRQGDMQSPISWAFVKNPMLSTVNAWQRMLRRDPRTLRWNASTYAELNAPDVLQSDPPSLDNEEIWRFRIGCEPDDSRTQGPVSAVITVAAAGDEQRLLGAPFEKETGKYSTSAALTVGLRTNATDKGRGFCFPVQTHPSPLRLWEHLAAKLILNTVSTGTMVRLGRVRGNAMIWLSPSNKKLIDRGSRLIAHVTGCSYERACETVHEAMEQVKGWQEQGKVCPSPVALAIDRLSGTERH